MQRRLFGRVFCSSFLFIAGLMCASHVLGADDLSKITLSEKVIALLNGKYATVENSKAIAITLDGQHAWYVDKRDNNSRAAANALYLCMRNHKHACRLFRVGDYPIYDDYTKTAKISEKIIAGLPENLSSSAYGDETIDKNVDVIEGLRDENVSGTPTPLKGPDGVIRITTPELVKLYKTKKDLVVIDALGGAAGMRTTLPNALWISGIGTGADKLTNLTIDENLAIVLPELVPSKNTPVVVYCAGWQCWHSWNAARRLSLAGYTNVLWYRGGIWSWKDANLPVVDDMPAAAMVR